MYLSYCNILVNVNYAYLKLTVSNWTNV